MDLNNCAESLMIEEQKRIKLNFVESVDGFSEELLRLTVKGKKVIIKGEKIRINQFNKDSGNLVADGLFYQINYSGQKKPAMKKIFG